MAARLVAGGGWRGRGDIENDVADWPAAQTQAAPGPVYPLGWLKSKKLLF